MEPQGRSHNRNENEGCKRKIVSSGRQLLTKQAICRNPQHKEDREPKKRTASIEFTKYKDKKVSGLCFIHISFTMAFFTGNPDAAADAMGLVSAPIVEKEPQDARERRANPSATPELTSYMVDRKSLEIGSPEPLSTR